MAGKLLNENASRIPDKEKTQAVTSSAWWWWEIGGAILALACLFLTIAVLAGLDHKPIDDWGYTIQPSSLLSTLSTVGKMGLTLVVASSVSQLKWLHFLKPNRLSHLDILDETSRAGPWDILTMFVKMRRSLLKSGPDFMVALLALVTLGSFAIDPMIQQVLDTPQSEIPLNETASIMASRRYDSRALGVRETFDNENNSHGKSK